MILIFHPFFFSLTHTLPIFAPPGHPITRQLACEECGHTVLLHLLTRACRESQQVNKLRGNRPEICLPLPRALTRKVYDQVCWSCMEEKEEEEEEKGEEEEEEEDK